ncbi:MAG: ABC transporter permease [Deltaproteobacteria bacterium]|nr:ABC transporter permease [Deltaproteobacteria bacterium]
MVASLAFSTLVWALRPPYRGRLLIAAMEFVGVQSIFIVGLTGTFTGMVFGLQLVYSLRQFGAENTVGGVVALALSRELAPVFTGLMVTSRAGSSMATELGTMRVTDQIDALATMAVNPVQYLVVPRVIAGILTVPALCMLFNVVGMFGAYVVSVYLLSLDPGVFVARMSWQADGADIMQGLVKSAVFGGTIALVACRQGFYASGGAAGVGQATTRAVVQSSVAILVLNYFITSLMTSL